MKKIVLIMLVFVVSLSLAAVAMAVAPKPPASICVHVFGPGLEAGVYALAVKPGPNIKLADGTQKFYSIQGALIDLSPVYSPVVGAGYMEGNIFHFTLNTTYHYSGTPNFIQWEGLWDVIAKTGSMYGYFSISGSRYSLTLEQVDCTGEVIVYSEENARSPYLLPNQ